MKFKYAMWGEPMPKWRKAQKQHQCQGDGCAKIIAVGEGYLDQALRDPPHRRFYFLARYTGQRRGDCCDMQWSDLLHAPDHVGARSQA